MDSVSPSKCPYPIPARCWTETVAVELNEITRWAIICISGGRVLSIESPDLRMFVCLLVLEILPLQTFLPALRIQSMRARSELGGHFIQ